jgi:hypothetical protein
LCFSTQEGEWDLMGIRTSVEIPSLPVELELAL